MQSKVTVGPTEACSPCNCQAPQHVGITPGHGPISAENLKGPTGERSIIEASQTTRTCALLTSAGSLSLSCPMCVCVCMCVGVS